MENPISVLLVLNIYICTKYLTINILMHCTHSCCLILNTVLNFMGKTQCYAFRRSANISSQLICDLEGSLLQALVTTMQS